MRALFDQKQIVSVSRFNTMRAILFNTYNMYVIRNLINLIVLVYIMFVHCCILYSIVFVLHLLIQFSVVVVCRILLARVHLPNGK